MNWTAAGVTPLVPCGWRGPARGPPTMGEPAVPSAPSAITRTATSPVALRLDQPAPPVTAIVRGALGGGQTATVQTHTDGGDFFARKQLDLAHPEDISIQVGSTIPTGLFDWIAASWGAKPPARDGALLRCDATYTVRRETPFRGALIAETSFPALDAASHDPGRLTVRLTPVETGPDTMPGTKLQASVGKGVAKVWLTSNFRLQIDDVDCTKVQRIEPFAVRRPIDIVQNARGRPSLRAGAIDFPSLRITVSSAAAETWFAWHQAFVVDGKNADSFEKSGSISLFAPNLVSELARIELSGLGIFRLSLDPPELGGPATIARLTADVYCERMALVPGAIP
jgi:hypothetical protein